MDEELEVYSEAPLQELRSWNIFRKGISYTPSWIRMTCNSSQSRRKLYTKHNVLNILRQLEEGHTERVASESQGVPYNTHKQWKFDYQDYKTVVNIAKSIGMQKYERTFLREALSDPHLALKYIERRNAEEWGETKKVEYNKLTPEQILSSIELAIAGSAGEGGPAAIPDGIGEVPAAFDSGTGQVTSWVGASLEGVAGEEPSAGMYISVRGEAYQPVGMGGSDNSGHTSEAEGGDMGERWSEE